MNLRSIKDFFSRKRQDEELQEELRFHLEMQESENRRSGMDDEAARRSAVLKLGGVTQIREEVRSQSRLFWLETLYQDASYAIRTLRKSPAFTFVALATLAVSIGACTALFSLFYGILLCPLPYPDPDRLIQVQDTNPSMGIAESGVSARNVMDWSERASGLKGVAAYYTMGRTLTADGGSEVVLVSQVSADFFRVMGVPPLIGRTFTQAETERTLYGNANGLITADPLIVISHALWISRFGGDPHVAGKSIVLDRRSWKIIGVMPAHFAMPDEQTGLWIPWGIRKDNPRDQHFAGAVARLAPHASLAQAEMELNAIMQSLAIEHPEMEPGWGVRMTPLREAMTGNVKTILWVLLAAVALVLMIACANLATLQLSRASARLRESSLRRALGASRGRLIRQFLVESMMLALAGGLLGVLMAHAGIAWLRLQEPGLPRLSEVSLDPAALLWSLTLTTLSVMMFGLGPALVGAGGGLMNWRGVDTPQSTAHLSARRFRNALVVLEIALAVILLSSSSLLIRSFARLTAVHPGFDSRNVLVLPVFLDMEKYSSGEKSRSYYAQLFERLREIPGVQFVGGATALPASLLGPDFKRPVWDSSGVLEDSAKRFADVRMVTPDYFRTLRMSVLQGRGFTKLDSPEAPGVVMVNRVLARQIWPAGDAVGKRLVVDYSTSGTYSYEVIGIVNDVRFHGLRSEPRPEIYFPHAQRSYLILNVAIRTTVDPRRLIPAVRDALYSLDPQKPAHNITPLDDLVGATVIRERYAMMLVTCFATAAFALALLGIYGVLAYSVRQRVREIGIRIALGAGQRQIVRWITGQGTKLLLAGLGSGLIAAAAFVRLLSGILFQVRPLDPASFSAAVLILTVTALAACWLPARRAARTNPSIALRCE